LIISFVQLSSDHTTSLNR